MRFKIVLLTVGVLIFSLAATGLWVEFLPRREPKPETTPQTAGELGLQKILQWEQAQREYVQSLEYRRKGFSRADITLIKRALDRKAYLPPDVLRIDLSLVEGKTCTFRKKQYPLAECILPSMNGLGRIPNRATSDKIGYCEDRYFEGRRNSCTQFVFYTALLDHPELLKQIEHIVRNKCDYFYPLAGRTPTSRDQINERWLALYDAAMARAAKEPDHIDRDARVVVNWLGGQAYEHGCTNGMQHKPIELTFVNENYEPTKTYLLEK